MGPGSLTKTPYSVSIKTFYSVTKYKYKNIINEKFTISIYRQLPLTE